MSDRNPYDASKGGALLLSRKRAEAELEGFCKAELHFLRLQVNELRDEVSELKRILRALKESRNE